MKLYPDNIESKIGFDEIRKILKTYVYSDKTRLRIDAMKCSNDYEAVSGALSISHELLELIKSEQELPLGHFSDYSAALNRCRIEGLFLSLEETISLKDSIRTISKTIRFFEKETIEEKQPLLYKLAKPYQIHSYVKERIDAIVNKHNQIKDNASSSLLEIRQKLRSNRGKIQKILQTKLKEVQKEGWTDKDLAPTIINDRPVIPVLSTYKRNIKGIIHAESSTGKTAYVEPEAVVEVNNLIRDLENQEYKEICKILSDMTNDLRPYFNDLIQALELMTEIDFIHSKSIFAKKMDCILPSVCNKPISEWNNSRHPLLQKSLEKEKRKIVPLTISITEDNRIILISGPNAGGKSVCLKTKGLLQYMIQCGILPPMDEGSEAGIYNGIFIDIGDEQSIENDLSTYSSHLLNMKYFTRHANKGTLLLIDEFGSGTEPLLGGSLAESILEYLNKKECAGIITTHYSNLKHFAASEEGIINGAMLYDNHRMEPLYRLEIGKPGSSYAFEIARKIGLDERILETAQNKIGKEHVDFDKNLKDVLRDKRYWENKRKSIRQKEKKLEETLEKYQNKLNESEKDRKKIIQQAKDEAEGLLKASNKAIEKTIRIIKESKANKEKTKEAREELDNIKRKPITNHSEDKEIISKINDIKQQKKRFNLKEKDKEKEEERIKKNIDLTKNDLRVGDKVKLVDQDSLGEIMDINKNSVMVAFGNMFTTVPKDKLTKISNKEFKKQSKSESDGSLATMMYNKKINFNGNIDLRGKKVEEALYELERFIDDAIFVGTSQVRILHGKGFGILRQHIRDYLKSIDAIKKISNEHIERGGDGITLVDFD